MFKYYAYINGSKALIELTGNSAGLKFKSRLGYILFRQSYYNDYSFSQGYERLLPGSYLFTIRGIDVSFDAI
jgi:hypothetical protein